MDLATPQSEPSVDKKDDKVNGATFVAPAPVNVMKRELIQGVSKRVDPFVFVHLFKKM